MSGIVGTLRSSALGCVVALSLAGCAGQGGGDLLAAVPPGEAPDATGSAAPPTAAASLAEAKSLEVTGDRKKAYSAAALALASEPANPDVVVTYSRLAVGLGRTEEAEKALASAEASGVKDWRILSAKGAVLAEKGDLDGAKATLQNGLKLAPDQPALLNNLAFVYTLEGNPKMAEDLLRRASAGGGAEPKTQQNLALVLGLQGKYDESKKVGAAAASPEVAEANVAFLKELKAARSETKVAQASD